MVQLYVVASLQPLLPSAQVAGGSAVEAALLGITLHPPQTVSEGYVEPAARETLAGLHRCSQSVSCASLGLFPGF